MALAERILAVLAGLFGASGVALAAAAAHLAAGTSLESAVLMALVHAPSMLAGLAALRAGLLAPRIGYIGLSGLALGVLLFSGDLSVRAFWGHSFFPMAAPLGGMILILSWLALAIAGIFARTTR